MGNKINLTDQIYDLIIQTSTELPDDIRKIIDKKQNNEILPIMKETIILSKNEKLPICQDTGFPYFYFQIPKNLLQFTNEIKYSICEALKRATKKGFLRPNSVDPLNNINYNTNLGKELPVIDWEIKDKGPLLCYLLLKGGGSENVSGQYSLPFDQINAGRDKNGIINTVLFHLQRIQGKGCSPGIVGLGIGGDRVLSMKIAKMQLFRDLEDSNPDLELSYLEKEILKRANNLGIGPMGLGGSPTLLALKAGKAARHPASFFISISYLCWVARRNKCQLFIK